jgi:exonuclease VII large subunit
VADRGAASVDGADAGLRRAADLLAGRASGALRGASGRLDGQSGRLVARSRTGVTAAATALEGARRRLDPGRLQGRLATADAALVAAGGRSRRASVRTMTSAAAALDLAGARVAVADPARALARGWSLSHTADGRLVRRAGDLEPGDTLVTTFGEGVAHSTVTAAEPGPSDRRGT